MNGPGVNGVAFGPMNGGLTGEALQQRIIEAMAAVTLDLQTYKHRNPANLSGGEKKRVAIAGVLAMQPQILVLDEPSSQLDPRSRRQLINLLKELPLTQLIATHDLDLALELCPRTVILNQGKVAYDGNTERVMSEPEFLGKNHLEAPFSFRRPYCNCADRPRWFKMFESAV